MIIFLLQLLMHRSEPAVHQVSPDEVPRLPLVTDTPPAPVGGTGKQA